MKKFFSKKTNEHLILELRGNMREDFISHITPLLRECYIPSERLKRADTSDKMRKLVRAVVPDISNIRSGEFAELSTFLYLPHHCTSFKDISGPKKWHWKEEKNIPLKKVDVILFKTDPNNPSKDDLLVLAETKSKSVNGPSAPIKAAINGAQKDRTSRLAFTLQWLKDRAVKDENPDLEASMERFQKAVTNPFTRKFHGVAFIDSSLLDVELEKDLSGVDQSEIEVMIFSIPNLADLFNEVFKRAENA